MHVLDAIVNFGALGIIKAIEGAHEVAGDPADTLKLNTLADNAVVSM
jgi:hypothetical protein